MLRDFCNAGISDCYRGRKQHKRKTVNEYFCLIQTYP